MPKMFYSKWGLALLGAISLLLIMLVSTAWYGVRYDFTEGRLYTLSEGSRRMLSKIEQPIAMKMYFSRSQTGRAVSLRHYAKRVESLLQEYVRAGGGNITLEIIDPEPFSEDEDKAQAFGLQAVPVDNDGRGVFFGMIVERPQGNFQVLPFFNPDRAAWLEIDISQAIYAVNTDQRPALSVLSDLPIWSQPNRSNSGPQSNNWVAVRNLAKSYEINIIESPSDFDENVGVLLWILGGDAPSTQMLYAIDQHVMRGGKVMAFIDTVSDYQRSQGVSEPIDSAREADLQALLNSWGIQFDRSQVLNDADHALLVGGSQSQQSRHLGILGFNRSNFSGSSVLLSNLESINVASIGSLRQLDADKHMMRPLIVSSANSMLLPRADYNAIYDPRQLYRTFRPTPERYVVAAHVTGAFETAFPKGYQQAGSAGAADLSGQLRVSTMPTDIVLVADTDMLADSLWVRVQNFLGQQITSPFAGNGNFVLNLADTLLGSSDLIDIRSLGRYFRPFDRVNELKLRADERFSYKEQELLQRLEETESQLRVLDEKRQQAAVADDAEGVVEMTEEELQALQGFLDEKLRIRKELRDVRLELNQDIRKLGLWVKFINIALVPILLTILVVLLHFRARRRAKAIKVT